MYKKTTPLFLFIESPLHAGTGNDLGIVDLPIQRERHTGFPKIESSSLKGAIRDHFERFSDKKKVIASFGAEANDTTPQAGAIGVTDARLLFFPIKSMRGVFSWATCPSVLNQFIKDLSISEVTIPDSFSKVNENQVAKGSDLIINSSKIVLEEYTFSVNESQVVTEIASWVADHIFTEETPTYFKNKIKSSIVVLSDNDFTDFVQHSTEVITRTKIDPETGTVQDGALFTEEYLPSDSIMYSLLLTGAEFSSNTEKMSADDIETFMKEGVESQPVFQLGGNSTLGKGIIRSKLIG